MNRIGVALAADSAVTIGRGTKIYNSANKLFSLSKYHPVGIMIYGNADYMLMPWETIIKVYREEIRSESFDYVSEYAESFLEFLRNNSYDELASKSVEKQYTLNILSNETEELFNFILGEIKKRVNETPDVTDQELFNYGEVLLNQILEKLENEDYIIGFNELDRSVILEEYGERLDQIVIGTFENFIFSETMVTVVKSIVVTSLLKRFNSVSGIVIAGFGDRELYPSLMAYEIEGKVNSKLRYRVKTSTKIGHTTTASVIPFAQDDMVRTFIRGIDPDMENLSFSFLDELFTKLPDVLVDLLAPSLIEANQDTIKEQLREALDIAFTDYQDVLNDYKQDVFTTPILSIVNSLPKEELADMAEALVNLTSFKRKVSSSIESVGGPVDVAVITKGDGFVWIKRKHYFDSEKNQQFYQKYYWRDKHESVNSRENN